MSSTINAAVPCPVEDAEGEPCTGHVTVLLEWIPAEWDGPEDRGWKCAHPGHWTTLIVYAMCTAGHALTHEQLRTIEREAREDRAPAY